MSDLLKRQRGIGILEVVVAVYFLTFGILGLASLMLKSLQANKVTFNMMTASQLAQEGVEIVRQVRDNNWKTGANWKTGTAAMSATDIVQDGAYRVDYASAINDAGYDVDTVDDAAARLYIDASGRYQHAVSAVTTPYNRIIQVQDNGGNVRVTATVRWRDGTGTHDYVSETILYDWYTP